MTNTTRAIRLTPKQEAAFLNVAEHWGAVFCPLGQNWMVEKGLLRDATPAELRTHYAGLERELAQTHEDLALAVAHRDYVAAEQLANTAAWKVRELAGRERDQLGDGSEWLVTLSETGLALFAKLREKRAAALEAAR